MSTRPATYVRRALFVLTVLALTWAIAVALTGGFRTKIGSFHISSRSVANVVVLAMLSAALAGALWLVAESATTVRAEWCWWKGVGRSGLTGLQRWVRSQPSRVAGVIVLAGIGLDLYHWIGALPFWVDEEMIALNVRDRSFFELAGPLWLGQSAPLGWLLAERAVLLTCGAGEPALRMVPLAFGVATLVAAWWIGRRWMTPAAGALLALLCVFGQFVSHYRLQLKHYSADIFSGLLLPALAAWAGEAEDSRDRMRRAAIWWIAAAVLQWFANGAILVAPACALWLLVVLARRGGKRAALVFALFGSVWLVSFGANYQLSLQHTHHNRFLREYWAAEVPPPAIGPAQMTRWLAARLAPLAYDPGGTVLVASLWLCAVAGLAVGSNRALGSVFALVPLSSFALAAMRVVPLFGRFSIWIVPALYVGVVLLADRSVRVARESWSSRRWARVVVALVLVLATGRLAADIVANGSTELLVTVPRNIHRVNDRDAIAWLLERRQPGDALMATHLGWPAVYWYGGLSISDPAIAARASEDSATYEIVYVPRVSECERHPLRDVLMSHPRVLVFLGFPDVPPGFGNLLVDKMAELGSIVEFRQFTEISFAMIVDLRATDSGNNLLIRLRRKAEPGYPKGCVGARPVRRW